MSATVPWPPNEFDPAAPYRVLVVCRFNRTRSVMAAGLLQLALAAHPTIEVASAGFGPAGLPADPNAVRLLRTVGVDARDHASRALTVDEVAAANVVLCAERSHVFSVVADLGGRFEWTFTLPEYASGAGLNVERGRGVDYLYSDVGEIDEPTGRTWAAWERAWNQLQHDCAQAAERIVNAHLRR